MYQQDSIAPTYHYEDVATDGQPHYYRPATPEQALRLLPASATENQKDSIVQHYFKPVVVRPTTRPDTLGLPSGLRAEAVQAMETMDYGKGFFSENPALHPELKVWQPGIAGDPVPYRLQNDLFITSTLLLSFFVAIWLVSRSLHVFLSRLKGFFRNRERKDAVVLREDTQMKNQAYVIFLSCFLMGILLLKYMELNMPDAFRAVPPQRLLLVGMAGALAYYVLKYLLYAVCHWTFFPPQQCQAWLAAYNLLFLAKALLFFPLVLLVVYFNLPPWLMQWILLGIITAFECLVAFKSVQLFFPDKFGLLHIILYFCTLEIVPLLIAWNLLLEANDFMVLYI